ncbi:MAG TPA: hypothetical protein ENH01_03370 [Nitrospirae bacterium]|nr:hypothetical protein [Nitrospirota bacterium]
MTTPTTVAWLPEKLAEADFDDLNALEAAAYAIFQNDWTDFPSFRGEDVRVHRRPHIANGDRWNTYWHAVSEGSPEHLRTSPIPERLVRVPWCRPMVENESDAVVKVWANVRGRDQHICIWFDRINYIVILKQCRNHVLLKTAYCPKSRRKQQLHREYAAWKKTGRAL